MGEGKVVLPSGIAGIDRDEALPDRLRCLLSVESGREVALSPQHAADVGMGEGKVALPSGITGIDRGEALPDRLCSLMAVERGREIALSPEDIAHSFTG